jgi:hypothetical protein
VARDFGLIGFYLGLSHSYQECALPTELCGPVCMKLYCKSILVKSQLTVPILLWNVTYVLNRQIRREILKDDLAKVKKEV